MLLQYSIDSRSSKYSLKYKSSSRSPLLHISPGILWIWIFPAVLIVQNLQMQLNVKEILYMWYLLENDFKDGQ